ncbi:MAG: hypothetical protein LBJ63_10650 [Prevotellaceae bacterium]|jgi:hypothetical protein|nr:hypothetical protein [Prevotellaceae bacterium]
MLKSFPALNVEWLITGNGKMYKEPKEQSLFIDNEPDDLFSPTSKIIDNAHNIFKSDENQSRKSMNNENETDVLPQNEVKTYSREMERIIICYSDKTFEFYYPR